MANQNRILRDRIIGVIKGQMALAIRNGNHNASVKLTTIYKTLKAETEGKRANIRGILNRDFLNGGIIFERVIEEGKKRSGAYRLKIQAIQEDCKAA